MSDREQAPETKEAAEGEIMQKDAQESDETMLCAPEPTAEEKRRKKEKIIFLCSLFV